MSIMKEKGMMNLFAKVLMSMFASDSLIGNEGTPSRLQKALLSQYDSNRS